MVNLFVPNLNEVIALASLLDEIGLEKEAIILDNYIDEEFKRISASEPYAFVKRAGFWDDVWERIKGRVGRAVFKDFREAYEDAKKVQTIIEEKMDDLNERYKRISHDLKTYQLGDWYKNLSTFEEVNGEEVLSSSDFLTSYTKYRDKVIFKEQGTDKTEREVDKIYGPQEGEEGDPAQIGEWNAIFDKKNQGVQIHYEDDIVRIKTELWNRWIKGGHFKRVPDPTGEGDTVIMFNAEAKGRIPENLQAALGDDTWKINLMGKDDYVYLGKIEGVKHKPQEAPAEKEEEDVYMKTPDLPSRPLEVVPTEQGKKVWVRSKADPNRIALIPVENVNEDIHEVFRNKKDIDRLNAMMAQKTKKEEPIKETEELREASQKLFIRRKARLEKLLKLSEA